MSSPQVLVVEDEGIIAADIQDRLVSLGYEVSAAVSTGEEALQKIPIVTPDIVLMDIMLQGSMDGVEAAAQIREKFNIPVVFLTAHADESTVQRAKLTEPFAYIIKPFEERELHTALEMALHKHKMERERAKALEQKRELLDKTVEGTIKVLTKILSVGDPQSFDLGQKLRDYMKLCTDHLKLAGAWECETAALLSRIGFVTIPAILIQKVRCGMALTPAEKDTLNRIPEAGKNLLSTFPQMEAVARIVFYQNKNFNGTGIPADSVGGQNIPVGARILKILNDLVQHEADGLSKQKAIDKMVSSPGLYDPKLLEELSTALTSGPKKGKPVALKDLMVGQVIVEAIETNDGTLVLNAGNTISPWMLKKLQNFVQVSGIKEPIYVEK